MSKVLGFADVGFCLWEVGFGFEASPSVLQPQASRPKL